MSDSLSFSKSVIIPLELYEKNFHQSKSCPPKKEFDSSKDILTSDLPSDLKLKLFNQRQETVNQMIRPSQSEQISNIEFKEKIKASIYQSFPEKDRKVIRDLFELYIDRYPYEIDWNPNTLEVIIDERTIENSNLISILKYLLNPQGEKPIAAYQVYARLRLLNVPSNWFGTVMSQIGSSQDVPSFSTPSWSPYSSRLSTPVRGDPYTPIAARVKERRDRKAKVPYSPARWQNLK